LKSGGASVAVLLFLSLVGNVFAANTTPAPRNGALPDIVVQTDDGRVSHLGELLRPGGEGSVLLLPLFTRCSSTCPILLHKLENSLGTGRAPGSVRVLVFSFDPAETQASLSAFRSASGMPAGWTLAHADEEATRILLQYFNYPVMSRGAVFIHPSEVFVLDKSLRWKWTVSGVNCTPANIREAVERSSSEDIVTRFAGHPDVVAWIAFGLALCSVCVVVAFWSRNTAAR